MKTSLDHLPEDKQHEIKLAAEIIKEMVRVDMLILFGSYARGDWVEDRQPDGINMHEYRSDFDILAVVKHEALATKIERKQSLRDKLRREIRTPISIVAEDIHFLNRRLSEGQYFYRDILKEGIVLYDSGKLQLETPKELHPNERKQLAIDDFEYWFSSAKEYLFTYNFLIANEKFNIAAFNLHQVAERLYTTLLLVFVYYKPNTHDLEELHQKAIHLDKGIHKIFPKDTPEEKHLFELLRKAYVDARYKKSYKITREELQVLGERVKRLESLAETLCKLKIDSF